MALPPRDGSSSSAGFSEMNEELATARDALLRFAESEGVLSSLVGDRADPESRYADLASVRNHATVDELLRLVGGLPEGVEDDRGEEANSLYPTLLELAEVFDILIDQHSLVYGDAAALADAMADGWHAMAGCYNHEPSPDEATRAVKQLSTNLTVLPPLLDSVGRLSPEARREVVSRLGEDPVEPWRAESRHFALHAVDTWLTQGISDPRVLRALQPARTSPAGKSATDANALFARATADLLLGRLVRGVSRDIVSGVLEAPFAGVLRNG